MYQRILISKFLMLLWLLVSVSCSPGGSKELDPVFGGSDIGDSAFTSTPSSLDYGNVSVSAVSTKTLVVKNSSNSNIYISTIATNSGAYQVVSEDCPQSPAVIAPDDACTINVQFAPSVSGIVGAAVGVRYGISAAADSQYVTNFGVTGRGISPLVFAGVQSLGPQTNKTMTLNWTANSDATSYIIFRMIGAMMVFEKTIVNASGTVNSDVVTGLQPSTSYTWRVRAVDVFGASDTNTTDLTASTNVNQSPALGNPGAQTAYQGSAWSVNINDSNTANDTDLDGDNISYTCFYDLVIDGSVASTTACSSLANEDTTAAAFNSSTGVFGWTPPFAVVPGTQYEVRITGTDPFAGSGSQIFVLTVNSGVPILDWTPAGHFTFPSAFVSSASPMSADFTNSRTGSDAGVSSYACLFDRIIDGAMLASASCNTLPGTASFNTTTGLLNWTPLATTWGPYEIYVSATNAAGTDGEYVKVDVRSDIHVINLLTYWDASFADGEKFGVNSPRLTNWKDLTTAATTYDGSLTQFAGIPTSGWNSTTVPSLFFDGVNDQVSLSNVLTPLTDLSIDTWVQPQSGDNSIILSNSDGAGLGLTLKQSSFEVGKWVLVAGENTFEDEIMLDNPDGFWRFNEPTGLIAYDISNKYEHGVYSASVTKSQTGGMSDGDSAVGFNGSNGSMQAPVTIGTTVSIEVWAQTTTVGSTPMLWRTGPNGVGPDLFFYNNRISLNTWDSDNNFFCTMPATATDGAFHQYVVTIDQVGNTATLYFDGALCGTAAYRNPSAGSITFSSGLGSYEWNGRIDEAAVYSTVLSPARILAHYNARNRATCRSSMAVNPNQWTHIFAGYNNGTRNLNMWVNGKNQCSSTNPTPLASSAQALTLGRSVAGNFPWQGKVGELRTYSSATNTPATTNFNISQSKYEQYVPTQGMRLWLRADSLSYLGNGASISYWKDQSGLNNHALAAAVGDQPSYSSAGINGKPAVSFNSDCLRTQYTDTLGDYSVFVVFQDNGVPENYERILDKEYTGGFWIGRDDSNSNLFRAGVMQSAPPYGSLNTFADVSAHVLTSIRSGTNHTVYANGASPVSQTISSAATSSTAYGIGCWHDGNGTQRLGGMISEVLIYDSALSSSDRTRVERYLGSKHSITVP